VLYRAFFVTVIDGMFCLRDVCMTNRRETCFSRRRKWSEIIGGYNTDTVARDRGAAK